MATTTQRITPFFWFNDQAEEAVTFYTSIFPNSRIGTATRTIKEIARMSGQKEGSIMTVEFVLDGQQFSALNGGPAYKFTEALSLVIHCETQEEVDHYWDRLREGGDESAQQCGWLKDRYGVSWQVVPSALHQLLGDPDPNRARRAAEAMMGMKKLDIAALRRAAG